MILERGTARPAEAFAALRRWCEQQGGKVDARLTLASARDDPNDRTFCSTAPIEPYTNLISLPRTACLNEHTMLDGAGATIDRWRAALDADASPLDAHVTAGAQRLLGLLVVCSTGPGGFFWPYVATLPTMSQIETHPVVASADSMRLNAWRAVSPAFAQAVSELRAAIVGQCAVFRELNARWPLFAEEELAEDLLVWATVMLLSRQWSDDGLLPLIDMSQHSGRAKSGIATDSDRVTLFVDEGYAAGVPIWNNYGLHDSCDMLLRYGFFSTEHCVPALKVTPRYLGRDAIDAVVLQTLAQVASARRGRLSFHVTEAGLSGDLDAFLRMSALHRSDMPAIGAALQSKSVTREALTRGCAIVDVMRTETRPLAEPDHDDDPVVTMLLSAMRAQEHARHACLEQIRARLAAILGG